MQRQLLLATAAALGMLVHVPAAVAENPATGPRPLGELPYTPSLEPAFMDRTIDPCVDFYAYACNGWRERNPIPPDRSSWSVYAKAYDENQQFLWGTLELAAAPDPSRTPERQKIGDYFAACMDLAAIDAAGIAPAREDLAAIAALDSREQVAALLGRLHRGPVGRGMLFGFGADQDPGDATQVIAFASAGGLGLPDRDYYFKEDERSTALREQYRAHVRRTLELAGEPAARAASQAEAVLRIESALAKASLTRVERRDPYKVYHRTSLTELERRTPAFRWRDYLAALGAAEVQVVNLTEPAFFDAVAALVARESLDDLRGYLRWHLLRAWSPYLARPFRDAAFDFYSATLRGVPEPPPRWKECVGWVDRDLGEALGKVFVEATFRPETKRDIERMVGFIEQAMKARIRALDWMSAATRERALDKLATLRNKIGYPETWRDYSALAVRRDDFFGNVRRAAEFESRRELGKIGKPVDRGEWGMTPPTVNAYYNPSMNDMNFPAGVLLPPLYDPKLDDAPNYGNTGGTIGHELTHGFDDEGRQFDAQGNLKDWWTAEDAKAFEQRADCVAEQYAQYPVVDELKINSRLSLGEDVADLGGTILAWEAWKLATAGQPLPPRDGLTPEQRFFVGYAQWVCENQRPEQLRLSAATNPHSPGIWRINGSVANMPEFATAFACKPGQPMVRPAPCRIW